MNLITYKNADKPFLCTQAQADTLDRLAALNKGGIGSVKGYRPSSKDWTTVPTLDLQILTRFEYPRLLARRKAALEGITFADVAEDIAKHPKLAALSAGKVLEQFNACKEAALATIDKTESGDRSDAHRQGHDRCYARIAEGVKVNLVTEKNDDDGLMYPVLTDGVPTLATIMLPYLELNRSYRVQGERKVVNSGPKVLMDGVIRKKLNTRSVEYKTLSLKADNFESLNVGKQHITPDDLATVEVNMSKSKLVALLEAAGFSEEAQRIVEALNV